MFEKLLGKSKKTEIIGTESSGESSNGPLEEVAYITFTEFNGGFSEPIGQKLTIGSEIGELVIEDDSISARHCTFIKNQNVICIIDHSSVQGTFLNKKKLDPGRTFIINSNDKIKIGKLQAVLEYLEVPTGAQENTGIEGDDFEGEEIPGTPEVPVEQSINEVPEVREGTSVTGLIKQLDQSELTEKDDELNIEEGESKEEGLAKYFDDNHSLHQLEDPEDVNNLDVEEVELDPSVLAEEEKIKPKKRGKVKAGNKKLSEKKGKAKLKKLPAVAATNILFRFFAFVLDGFFALTILNIFYVFIDFQNFYNDAPSVVGEILKSPFEMATSLVPELAAFVKDVSSYKYYDEITSFLILIFLLRFFTTLLLSVSIGQFIIGIRSYGHGVFKRLMGGVREVFGCFTIPFLVFDFPTFFGKRSFKEIITKTHLHNDQAIVSLVLSIFFIPTLGTLACLSPIMKGLEVLPAIEVTESPIKNKPWTYKNKVFSELLGVQYDLAGHVSTLPSFQINQKNKKRYLTLGLLFLDLENGNTLEVKKTKEFSMLSVYKDFVKHNLLSEYFFPHLDGIVNDVALNNKNFKNSSGSNSTAIIEETKKIVSSIFPLKLGRVHEFVLDNGPVISGHRDFREKIENLVQDKIKVIKFTSFGRKEGIQMSHIVGRNDFYSYLPLGSMDGQLFVMSEDISNPKLRLLTNHIKFGESSGGVGKDPIAEFTNGFKLDPAFENLDLAQAVYDRYFSLSQEFLKSRNDTVIFKIQRNIRNLIEVLKENKMKNVKLMLNLSELLEALKKRDDEFFNIKRTKTV